MFEDPTAVSRSGRHVYCTSKASQELVSDPGVGEPYRSSTDRSARMLGVSLDNQAVGTQVRRHIPAG
jgi:hypothetical protein